jgi:RNA polymerase sigma-70 factor (ECF subfamily)
MQTESVDVTGAANEHVSQWTPPSWEEVVREHSGRVYRLAFRLTGNSHDAEDLTQEVFVRVFRSLPTYSPGTFEGWLHRITTNLFLDMTRRRQRIRFEGLGEETAAKLRGAEPTPSQAFDERHLDFDISAALADLPPEYRAAVVLCDIEGLTYEEIADVLGVKLGTVRSRIHRGRAQLRAALEHRRPRRPGAALLSDVTKPTAVKPEIVKPRAAEPDLARAELATAGLAVPELATPELATPELAVPELAVPELATPELATAEVTQL